MSVDEVVEQQAPVRKRTTRTPRSRAAVTEAAAPVAEATPAIESPNGAPLAEAPAMAAAPEAAAPAPMPEPVNAAPEAPAIALPDKTEGNEGSEAPASPDVTIPAETTAGSSPDLAGAAPTQSPEPALERERSGEPASRHSRDRRHRRDGRGRPEGDRPNGAERGVLVGDGHDGRASYAPARQRPGGPSVQVGPPPSRNGGPPHLTIAELDSKSPEELFEMARGFELQGYSRMNRQDLMIKLLQAQTEQQGNIFGDGVLEIIEDGFGFLRGPRFLPGPDDIYVSQSQIRRFGLRTGDRVSGQVRPPKENEKFFSLLRVEAVNGVDPGNGAAAPALRHADADLPAASCSTSKRCRTSSRPACSTSSRRSGAGSAA